MPGVNAGAFCKEPGNPTMSRMGRRTLDRILESME